MADGTRHCKDTTFKVSKINRFAITQNVWLRVEWEKHENKNKKNYEEKCLPAELGLETNCDCI